MMAVLIIFGVGFLAGYFIGFSRGEWYASEEVKDNGGNDE